MARVSSTFIVFMLAVGSSAACGGSSAVDYFGGASVSGGGSVGGAGGVGGGGAGGIGGGSGTGISSAGAAAGAPASGGQAATAGGDSDGGARADAPGAGGSTTSGPGDAPCSPVTDGQHGATGAFGSMGPFCLRVSGDIAGWGCSNFQGRTVKVNGMALDCGAWPLPDKLQGDYYFDVSAGDFAFASLFWY